IIAAGDIFHMPSLEGSRPSNSMSAREMQKLSAPSRLKRTQQSSLIQFVPCTHTLSRQVVKVKVGALPINGWRSPSFFLIFLHVFKKLTLPESLRRSPSAINAIDNLLSSARQVIRA